MNLRDFFVLFMSIIFFSGCQTMKPQGNVQESRKEQEQSIKSVVGAISGKSLSDEDFNKLKRDISSDPQARSAIESISGSMRSGGAQVVKYCPVDGERYAAHLRVCPEHNVILEVLEE